MISRFPGTCIACGLRFPEGAEILYARGDGARHLACAGKSKAVGDEAVSAIHRGLKILAGVCDGAVARDGAGFNGRDAQLGHELAALDRLSVGQARLAAKILGKYHGQLSDEITRACRWVGGENGSGKGDEGNGETAAEPEPAPAPAPHPPAQTEAPPAGADILRGTLTRIRYQGDRGFLIAVLDKSTTIKGSMLSPAVGCAYALTGSWVDDPKWGRQFAFSSYSTENPTTERAVTAYLDGVCKWVGPEIARRLVAAYGDAVIETCKRDPDRVARDIRGLTAARASEISASLLAHEVAEKLELAMKEIFIDTKVSRRAIGRMMELWGSQAPEVIRADPYRMIDEVDGIGFLLADQVARKVGFDLRDPRRVRAGIAHVLKEAAAGEGHVCLPIGDLVEKTDKLLCVGSDAVGRGIAAARAEGYVVEEEAPEIGPGERVIYLAPLLEDEKTVAEKLLALAGARVEGETEIEPNEEGLAEDQVAAIRKAVASRVFVVTGAPGTGKTYTIRRILDSIATTPDGLPSGRKIVLAAPTGKAAKRMTELTGHEASTIHRLLQAQKTEKGWSFARDERNPIEADVIVLDEVSMLPIPLAARFLSAVRLGTRLILVGDHYQLPPVGPGNVLRDILAAATPSLPSVELTIIKRQAPDALIVRNCHAVKDGRPIEMNNSAEGGDFFFLEEKDPAALRALVLDLALKRLPAKYNADPLRDVQVISATREKGGASCAAINRDFQRRLHPHPDDSRESDPASNGHSGPRFRPGDKVIQTKNDYDLGIVNGDIGYVVEIDGERKDKKIIVAFECPDREVEIPFAENDLMLAYAITCHKFQGSEAKVVIVVVDRSAGPFLLQRNWIYTALSRARDVCVVVGQRAEIDKAIKRASQAKRWGRLHYRLRADEEEI